MKVAIIGSRGPTYEQQETAACLASNLSKAGYRISTGGARGIDKTAMDNTEPGWLDVFLPWDSYGSEIIPAHANITLYDPKIHLDWLASVDRYHPAPHRLDAAMHALMARNYGIVEGSALVVALPWRGSRLGGTGQGIRIAEALDIPVIVDLGSDLFMSTNQVLENAMRILAAQENIANMRKKGC